MTKKYEERLKGGEAKLEETMVPLRVQEMKCQCELDVAKAAAETAKLAMQLEAVLNQYPLVLANIVAASNALAIAKKNQETAKAIIAELF